MERDSEQKQILAQKLWLLGFLPQMEAKCYTPRGIQEGRSEITDIDVLGFKMDDFFRPLRSAVDCKTGKTSAINRAIWLKGLMSDQGIDSGFVISRKPIPVDHRQATLPWRITMVQEAEIEQYFKLTTGVGSISLACLEKEAWVKFRKDMPSQDNLADLLDYRDLFFWGDGASRGLRYTLMETRSVRDVLDPKQRLHVSLVADTICLFSVAFIQIVAAILPIRLITNDKEELDSLLKAHIYGGREVYNYMDSMRKMLVAIKHGQDASSLTTGAAESLGLPNWDAFLSSVRGGLEFPRSLIEIPRFLRVIAIDRVLYDRKTDITAAIPQLDAKAIQMAADIIAYFCSAAALPVEFMERIRGECDQLLLKMT